MLVILMATTSTAYASVRCTALPDLPPRPFRTSFNRVSGIPINIVKSVHIPQMAATKANSTIEPARPLANFPSSIWGDRFLSFSLDNSKLEAYVKAMEQPKEQLRRLILNPSTDSNEKLSLIYSLDRLGLTYLFFEDIDGQLYKLFNQLNLQTYHEADLYTISIHFQVFRKFGYKFSCDVFNKFKDFESGQFNEDISKDVRGMLSLYESAQLRIKGESILDEAFAFTETKLKSLEKTIQGTLAKQVKHALERPVHRGHPMVEARKYLSHFEEEISRNDSLVTLAKLHFNYLQLIQKEELQIVSNVSPHTQIEILGITFKIYTFDLQPILKNDTYDAYATIEEMRVLTHAINRHSGELPSFEEFMKFGLITSGVDILYKSALSGTGKIVTQEAIAWYESHPKILTAVQFIARLQEDVASFTTFGVSEDVAIEAIKNVLEERWKDINEGCLKPREVPMGILAPLVNIARLIDVFYKYNDEFTFPENIIKEYITLLFCVSVPM
ncbi:hypothetical protein M8C21_021648 [Ambrosia artemisiifolia]|uniref:Uncharacterized protein n=1 Tax=Ambrosia artemisiifolia TaxID=4212 RepID=A0AAD5G4A5_AMBAR|nr:hypothetical protein M8C21_021648 [Ambrosia artemisiifolia]